MTVFKDRIYRQPRIWSNNELKKVSRLFYGKIINVSGWRDQDKEGNYYQNYFSNAQEYYISNFSTEIYGYQGDLINELFIDLENELNNDLIGKFDVVFNHTVLEHTFEVFKSFENLCKLSKDIVIVIVPFIQQQHSEYGDYWRFTPLTIKKLFEINNMELMYLNFNNSKKTSIYIIAIGSKKPSKWGLLRNTEDNKISQIETSKDYYIGTGVIKNSLIFYLASYLIKFFR